MRKLTTSRVRGENNDLQFDSSGNHLLDFIAQGPDTLLDRASDDIKSNAYRYRKLVNSAFQEDPEVAVKIARFFRDRTQQSLKEQPLMMIAILDDELTTDQIMSILTVHEDRDTNGAVRSDRIDLLDTVRILSWHKFFNGTEANVSGSLLRAFSLIFNKRQGCLGEVLKYKRKTLPYGQGKSVTVGILEVIGMIKNFKEIPLPEEVKTEYEGYLYPRYRRKQSRVRPVLSQTREYMSYFEGNLKKGIVPRGITVEQVLSQGDEDGLVTLAKENRLSPYQIKINFSNLATKLTEKELKPLLDKVPVGMPHEVYAMAKAITGKGFRGDYYSRHQTGYTKPNPKLKPAMKLLFKALVNKYEGIAKKRVLCLADVSGSMGMPLTKKSTVTQMEFAAIMSYFTAHICGHRVFGTWDDACHLWQAAKMPSIEDFADSGINGGCSTDVVNTIKTVADHFKKDKDNAPEVLTLISDMQFNEATRSYSYYSMSRNKSQSVDEGLAYFKKIHGYKPELIFWNVNSNTTPAKEQNGVLLMGGYSAANINLMLGAIAESEETEDELLNPESILNYVKRHYN